MIPNGHTKPDDDVLPMVVSAEPEPNLLLLLGVPIDVLTMADALDRIADLVHIGRSTGRAHQVVTVNVDFLVNALRDEALHSILCRADLAVADGMPVLWAARLMGTPLPERIAGADMVPLLAARAADKDHSMMLLGGAPGVSTRAAEVLQAHWPALRVSAVECPVIESLDDVPPKLVESIRHACPDVLCVALGHPKQDRFIARYGEQLGVPVMVGVGGTLDFLTGTTRRAPLWMQNAGLEWLHRVAYEPRRLGPRYARDLVHFAPSVLRQGLRQICALPTSDRAPLDGIPVADSPLEGDAHAVVRLRWGSEAFRERSRCSRRMVVDEADLPAPSPWGILQLVVQARLLRSEGSELVLRTADPDRDDGWGRLLRSHLTVEVNPPLPSGGTAVTTSPDPWEIAHRSRTTRMRTVVTAPPPRSLDG